MKKIVLLSVLSLLLFTGCRVVGGGVRVVHVDSHPPSHAPAHGHRSHYMYHYYPDAEFYFDVHRNGYFYLDSGANWTFSVSLPVHLHRHLRNGYVEIEMDSNRPYIKHNHHRSKYKKHNNRYKKKYKTKREVRKEKHNNRKSHEKDKKYKKYKKRKDDEEDDRRDRRY